MVVFVESADNDMAHFADGRPVMGGLRMCDGSQYLQPWHPYAFQDTSREIRTVTTRNGTRKRIIVSARGVLDTVSEFPGCESPSWAVDW